MGKSIKFSDPGSPFSPTPRPSKSQVSNLRPHPKKSTAFFDLKKNTVGLFVWLESQFGFPLFLKGQKQQGRGSWKKASNRNPPSR